MVLIAWEGSLFGEVVVNQEGFGLAVVRTVVGVGRRLKGVKGIRGWWSDDFAILCCGRHISGTKESTVEPVDTNETAVLWSSRFRKYTSSLPLLHANKDSEHTIAEPKRELTKSHRRYILPRKEERKKERKNEGRKTVLKLTFLESLRCC